jgi:hypothetical protein
LVGRGVKAAGDSLFPENKICRFFRRDFFHSSLPHCPLYFENASNCLSLSLLLLLFLLPLLFFVLPLAPPPPSPSSPFTHAQALWNDKLFAELVQVTPQPTCTTETVAAAAVNAAFQQTNICAIVALSTSGTSARWVSKYRPRCPVIVVTRSERTARAVTLHRGVVAAHYKQAPCADDSQWQADVDARLAFGVRTAVELGLVSADAAASHQNVVLIQGWGRGSGKTNALRIVATADILKQ